LRVASISGIIGTTPTRELPQEKNKITRLHKTASEKLYQLNGKLRAVNQLIAI
jgi:hypothetical protein